jgi:hypothetical protein
MEPQNLSKTRKMIRYAVALTALLATLQFGLLALLVVLPDKSGTAQEVSGTANTIGQPIRKMEI